jgi:4-hydroxy-2-oxoglutarate aldolase
LNGYFGGRPRLPLLASGGEERAEIETLMQGMRN